MTHETQAITKLMAESMNKFYCQGIDHASGVAEIIFEPGAVVTNEMLKEFKENLHQLKTKEHGNEN